MLYVSLILYLNYNVTSVEPLSNKNVSEFCVALLLIASSWGKREIYFLVRLRSASYTLRSFIGCTDRLSDGTFEAVRHRFSFFKFSNSQFLKESQEYQNVGNPFVFTQYLRV